MSGHRGKLTALATAATMGDLLAEYKRQAEVSLIELQEILEKMRIYLMQARQKLDEISIDIEQLKLDKEAKVSLLHKARAKARLPSKPKINKSWIVKPTIRARLPFY